MTPVVIIALWLLVTPDSNDGVHWGWIWIWAAETQEQCEAVRTQRLDFAQTVCVLHDPIHKRTFWPRPASSGIRSMVDQNAQDPPKKPKCKGEKREDQGVCVPQLMLLGVGR